MLDADTKLSSGLSEKIWHSGQAKFEKQKIKSRAWDAEWDLSLFSDSADSLFGILREYARCSNFSFRKRKSKKARQKIATSRARTAESVEKYRKVFHKVG